MQLHEAPARFGAGSPEWLTAITSAQLCRLAITAREHIFECIGADEPDLGLNVVFAADHARLLRPAGA
jgi:hypothetical protein